MAVGFNFSDSILQQTSAFDCSSFPHNHKSADQWKFRPGRTLVAKAGAQIWFSFLHHSLVSEELRAEPHLQGSGRCRIQSSGV